MSDEIPISDAIAAVREAVIPCKSQYAVGLQYRNDDRLRAAVDYLFNYERVVAERDNAIDGRNDYCAQYKREQVTAFQYLKERDAARAELAAARQTIADLGESVGKLDVALAEAQRERLRSDAAWIPALVKAAVEPRPLRHSVPIGAAPPPEDAMEAAHQYAERQRYEKVVEAARHCIEHAYPVNTQRS